MSVNRWLAIFGCVGAAAFIIGRAVDQWLTRNLEFAIRGI